jgi:hypothetical protein
MASKGLSALGGRVWEGGVSFTAHPLPISLELKVNNRA